MPQLKLGKMPAKDDSRDLLFARYVEPVKLPTPPPQFGHETLFRPKSWGMLGNDEWGDCAWAGPGARDDAPDQGGQVTRRISRPTAC